MKPLLLLIAGLLIAQSLPASGCDMNESRETAIHAQHAMEGGSDCCEELKQDADEDCQIHADCGICLHGVPGIASLAGVESPWNAGGQNAPEHRSLTTAHCAPLFKPPIT